MKFKFASLQSDSGKALLKKLGLEGTDFDSLVLVKAEKYVLKSTAVLHVLKTLGGAWSLFYGFIILPAFIRNFVYDFIAKNRYKYFGQRDVCMVPDASIKDRFLV